MRPPILEARDVVKRFSGIVALNRVSFDLRFGEIHALCGENGAGKSTLIKLLSGLHGYRSYEGELLVRGKIAKFRSLADAQQEGVAVIYQELALVPEMTVAENIFLGNEPRTAFGLIDWREVYRQSKELLERFDVEISPETPVHKLGVGHKQLVEIIKALSKNSQILILDEPTAALSEPEVQILMNILRGLRRVGISCIYISHKLEEVFAVSDRITVLRDGASIATFDTAKTCRADVIKHMVGREIHDLFPRREKARGECCLRLDDLCVRHPNADEDFLKGISLSLRGGEVLGIGGLMGAGRSELLMHLMGMWGTRSRGRVFLGNAELSIETPHDIIRRGMVLVSEDRRRYGLVMEKSIGFNLSLSSLGGLTKFGLIQRQREFEENQRFSQLLRVRAPTIELEVGKLSGGNQQKVVLGKALMTEPQVILLDEPTRGIDVGAKLEIYKMINRLTASGKAVLLVSSELHELIGMCDRILMLHEGKVGGAFAQGEATPERLLAAAMGRD